MPTRQIRMFDPEQNRIGPNNYVEIGDKGFVKNTKTVISQDKKIIRYLQKNAQTLRFDDAEMNEMIAYHLKHFVMMFGAVGEFFRTEKEFTLSDTTALLTCRFFEVTFGQHEQNKELLESFQDQVDHALKEKNHRYFQNTKIGSGCIQISNFLAVFSSWIKNPDHPFIPNVEPRILDVASLFEIDMDLSAKTIEKM